MAGAAACSGASGVLLIQRRRDKGLRERGNRGRKEKEKGRKVREGSGGWCEGLLRWRRRPSHPEKEMGRGVGERGSKEKEKGRMVRKAVAGCGASGVRPAARWRVPVEATYN